MGAKAASYAVLGPVGAVDDQGAPIELGGAQRRALLAQLVLAWPRSVSVDALSDGLWGDRPPQTATKSIQVHVSRLRQVLPPDDLVTSPPGYRLDADKLSTDLGCFEADAAAGRAELADGRVDEADRLLHRALGRWSGPALADVTDYPFASAEAARLDEARLAVLDDRIAVDLALGRQAALVAELETLVHRHPFRESLWAALMTALAQTGRQADALAAFGRARAALVDAHGLDPGAELQRLERQILDGAIVPTSGTIVQSPTAAGATDPGPAVQGASSPPTIRRPRKLRQNSGGRVVGRDVALDRLEAGLQDVVTDRRARGLAVLGDEGMGKTSLIASFADRLGPETTYVAGRCREELIAPYIPWVDVLHGLGGGSELLLIEGEDPGTDSPERRRAQLFGGVVDRLRGQAALGPLVITFDDLHWADAASVSLLIHALDELTADPVLFVLAWRSREVFNGHPTSRLEHRLNRDGADLIEMTALEPNQIAELVALAYPEAETAHVDAVADRLRRVTSGVPLFAAEAIATLRAERPDLLDPAAVAVALPRTVRTLISRRLAGAGRRAQAVAEACAVLSEPLDPSVVTAMTDDSDQGAVVLALDDLVVAGVLHEAEGGHVFAHAAFREAVLASMLGGRRQMLYAAAHRALAGSAQPAALVRLAQGAGALFPPEVLHGDLLAAGGDAVRRGAFVDAAAFFERALQSGGTERAPDALVGLADARWRSGDIAGAKAVTAEVVERAGEPGLSDRTLTDAVVLHGIFGALHAADPVSLRLAERALEVVTESDQRVRLTAALGYHMAIWGAPLNQARSAVARATAVQTSTTSWTARSEVLFAEGLSLLGDADLDHRFEVAAELKELGRTHGSWRDIGRALRLRCFCEMSAGRLDALDGSLDELFEVADRTGSWLYHSDAARWRITAALARDDVDSAAADLDELVRTSASQLAGRAFADTQRFLVAWARGELGACIAYLDDLRAATPDAPRAASDRRLVDLCRMWAQMDAGAADEARAEFVAMAPQRDLDRAPCRCYVSELVITADLMAQLEITDGAGDVLARLAPFRSQFAVLSWGESLLGSIGRYEVTLRSLVERKCDEPGFAASLASEEASGLVAPAERTRAARERARQLG